MRKLLNFIVVYQTVAATKIEEIMKDLKISYYLKNFMMISIQYLFYYVISYYCSKIFTFRIMRAAIRFGLETEKFLNY